MQPPFPCPVETWHNDTYEAISPSRPELSVAGKTVVIVGGGSGIGRESALAFADAGAAHVALLGRTESRLNETSVAIPSSTPSSVHVADVTDLQSLEAAAAAVGKWQILVLASGYCPTPATIASSDIDEWFKGFEINAKGALLTAKAFLPNADASSAVILGLTSDTSLMPTLHLPGLSSYVSSKLAQAKIFEFLAAENTDIFIATVHPGMVETDNFYRSGATPETVPSLDKVQLPAHFLVWMASPEAAFLRGRAVWANWDVEQLKAKKELGEGLFMTAGFKGLP